MLPEQTAARPMLVVEHLQAGYGRKQVVFDIDVHADAGEIVAVLGHNGAGKTTMARTILGLHRALGGTVTFHGADVTRAGFRANVAAGMGLLPSERFVFADLTVADNLKLGAAHVRDADVLARRTADIERLFPILAERHDQLAGTMSGGQQRMVSLAMLLLAGPSLLILDEPSLGLAPALVSDLFDKVRELVDREAMSVLLLEQNVGQALRISDRAVVVRAGRTIVHETAAEARRRDNYWELF